MNGSGHAYRMRTSRWVYVIFFVGIMIPALLIIPVELVWGGGEFTWDLGALTAVCAAGFLGFSLYVHQDVFIDDEGIEQVRWSVSGRRRTRMSVREVESAKAGNPIDLRDVHGNTIRIMWAVFRGHDQARLFEKLDALDLPKVE